MRFVRITGIIAPVVPENELLSGKLNTLATAADVNVLIL